MNFLSRMVAALLLLTMCGAASAASSPAVKLCEDGECKVPWASEPYQWMSVDGQVLKSGVTDSAGNAFVIRAAKVSKYVLETLNRRWDYEVAARCWNVDFQSCIKLVDARAIDGFDDAKSVREREAKKAAEEDAKQKEKRERLRIYAEMAESNSDPLAWLGPLPREWPADDVRARWMRVNEQVEKEINAFADSKEPLEKFQCKSAAQFGDVPDEAAVQRFLVESQLDNVTDATWDAVVDAARKGNWQARWFVYANLKDTLRNNGNLALQYRVLQLKEWLVSQRVGPIYAEFEQELAATGLDEGSGRRYASPAYLLAAMRGSYTSMAGVGELLEDSNSSEAQNEGRAMVACAKANMPQLVH